MKSLPVAVKVGGAGVIGGGGIAGAGLLINDQLKKSGLSQINPTRLSEKLINESEAYLELETENQLFTVVTDNKNQVTLKVKANSEKTDSPFKTNNKWFCTIKGIAKKDTEVDLSNSNYANFSQSDQTNKFKDKFGKEEQKKKQYKSGFVKSCFINRKGVDPTEDSNWESTLVLKLEETSGKWVFSETDVTSVFNGTYKNPSDL